MKKKTGTHPAGRTNPANSLQLARLRAGKTQEQAAEFIHCSVRALILSLILCKGGFLVYVEGGLTLT